MKHSLWPSGESFFEDKHRTQLNLIKMGNWILIIAVSTILVLMFVGYWQSETRTMSMIVERGTTAIGLILSTVMAATIFIWSWSSYVHSNEASIRMRRSSSGKMLAYDSVGDQIDDFVDDLQSGHGKNECKAALQTVRAITLMLSTPLYGIEARPNPVHSMQHLVEALRRWAEVVGELEQASTLEIYLWTLSDHTDLWGTKNTTNEDRASKWFVNKNLKQVEEHLMVMIQYCKLFKFIDQFSDNQKFNLIVGTIPRNDTRLFLIKRKVNLPYALYVVFTKFDKKNVKDENFRMTGFSSNNPDTFTTLGNVKDSFVKALGEQARPSAMQPHILGKNPFRLFTEYFQLPDDWYGYESYKDLDNKHPEWWKVDFNKFDVNKAAKTICQKCSEEKAELKE